LLTQTAQSQSILVSTFFEALSIDKSLSGSNKTVMWDLYRLFALYTMENEGFECKQEPSAHHSCCAWLTIARKVFRCNAVSQADLSRLPARVQVLMARLRPHAVNLVDSWKIPDYLLDR
jgi:acyl-CoA oxidase